MYSIPWILHVDIDAFFASVEQARDPRLRGRPVIVGTGVIASCSYEARAFGLRAGMALHEARRLCPGGVFLAGHAPTYRAFAEQVFGAVRELSPSVETYLDDAYADLTGTERLHGGVAAAGEKLRREVRERAGLTVTVGIGPSRVVARCASKTAKPDGLRLVPAGEEAAFLAPFAIRDLPGVGPATERLLSTLAVRTVGDLARVPAEALERLLGAVGRALAERARGRDTRAVSRREVPHSISRETSFHAPTIVPHEIRGMLYYLVERAAGTARQLGLLARGIEVRVRDVEGEGEVASRTLPRPTDRDDRLFGEAEAILSAIHVRRVALKLVGVTLSRLVLSGPRQGDLFAAPADLRRPALLLALDRIRARYGASAVVAGPALALLGKLAQDSYGFVLRTPSLTK
ncbi:MAG: DNA polymerase IV [Planctomycetales bacterium]|nr:DNA polymerase IV [Planctomycetales bacterium]